VCQINLKISLYVTCRMCICPPVYMYSHLRDGVRYAVSTSTSLPPIPCSAYLLLSPPSRSVYSSTNVLHVTCRMCIYPPVYMYSHLPDGVRCAVSTSTSLPPIPCSAYLLLSPPSCSVYSSETTWEHQLTLTHTPLGGCLLLSIARPE
jgi:hypothetical protein